MGKQEKFVKIAVPLLLFTVKRFSKPIESLLSEKANTKAFSRGIQWSILGASRVHLTDSAEVEYV